MTGYTLPPEPPLDPPDDGDVIERRRKRYQNHLRDQAEEDYWYDRHHDSDNFDI